MNQQTKEIQVKENQDELEIDLVELLFYLRTKLVIILVGFFAGALIAGLITHYLITPKYTATTKMYMVSASSDSIVDLTDLNIGTSLSSDYVEMIRIRPIFEEVIEEEGLSYTYEEMLEMVNVSNITDTRILTITVESADPEEAKVIANALAEKAVAKLPKLMDTSKPNIAEYAILPEEKSSPSYSTNIMVGALGVTVVIVGILVFLFITDDTMKSAEDVEKFFGIMPLTVVPEGDIGSEAEKAERAKRRKKRRLKRLSKLYRRKRKRG